VYSLQVDPLNPKASDHDTGYYVGFFWTPQDEVTEEERGFVPWD
jgi:hypothetical protein